MRGGTFNSSSHVQNMAAQARSRAADGTFRLYPGPNAPKGDRGQRKHALGTFQSGHPVMGRQHYDVRYNLHICKALILMWGRNAYSSDSDKGGHPIEVTHGGITYEVFCHIDITTPRDNYLWHGVEGPHVVIESFRQKNTNRAQGLDDNCFWLSPNDVFKLYVWERDNNQGLPAGVPRSWPGWLRQQMVDRIVTKQQATAARKARAAASDDEGYELPDLF